MTDMLLSKPWQKFLAKFSEISSLDLLQWKEVHLLAYFCEKYEKHYGRKYALSYQGAPSKCTEIIIIKKVYNALDAYNNLIVKEYIDWVFEKKIKSNNLSIKAITFLLTKGMANEFLAIQSKKAKIEKTTIVPDEFKQIINYFKLPVETYGDLAFINKALQEDSESESRQVYKKMLEQLCSIGLKVDILNKL